MSSATDRLVQALDDALPQTQCTRCGYPDCHAYAQAIAAGVAGINQCPPGGAEGIARLAALTGQAPSALNPANGAEAPRQLAVIDEAWCIGCTLCLKACPVDCIVGGPKGMHTVISAQCTGCELCLPACPVDCISLTSVSGERTGWQAWSAAQAQEARTRYAWHRERLQRTEHEHTARLANSAFVAPRAAPVVEGTTAPPAPDRRAVIAAAQARARAARADRA